ncbi:sulfotransferase [Psychroflexus tropicus]|uniref:sulfotransferase n=1 Tax=Psychroflexus tropicus TaxID=197345 RepID=UPI003CCB8659
MLFKSSDKRSSSFDFTKSDSWEKLCSFSERDIPDIEFPAKNIEPKSLTAIEKSKRLLFQKIKQLL